MTFFKRFRFLLLTTFLCICTLAGIYAYQKVITNNSHEIGKDVKYIAYIGRYTDASKGIAKDKQELNPFDLLHDAVLTEYLKQVDLPNHNLKLKVFDCEKSGRISDSIYKVIAQDTSIVLVIDNTWGVHLKECSQTIKNFNIPVISINADKNHEDFGNNVIFTGSHDHTPLDMVAFLKQVLKVKKVNMVSETDYPLHELYQEALAKENIAVHKLFSLEGKEFNAHDSTALYAELENYYSKNPSEKNTWTLINTHSAVGNNLIAYLDHTCDSVQLIGHSYIANHNELKTFGDSTHNRLIICSNPTDALTKQMSQDIDKFKRKYPVYFENPSHTLFVERCYDAVEMIKNKFEYQQDTSFLRKEDFITYFRSLPNSTIVEMDELYIYDSTLTVLPELYFTEYASGKLHSYPLQLNEKRQVIPNLFFGMEIADIYDIDMNSNSFTSDFYYWVKLDSANLDAEKHIIFQNMKQSESSKELIFEKRHGATVYKLYKVSGIFYVNYNLDKYPFDKQEIYIRAEILNPSDKIKISFDQKSFVKDDKRLESFKITEWNKEKFYVTVDNEINRGMHGDPDIDEDKLSEFKNIYFRLEIGRKVLKPMLEIVLPLILIGLISCTLLFLKDISFENLGEVSIGVFMSIVAFSISFSASTPSSDSLTRADILFWITFIIVLINFGIVIAVNAIFEPEELKKMDIRKMSYAICVVYLFTSFGVIFL